MPTLTPQGAARRAVIFAVAAVLITGGCSTSQSTTPLLTPSTLPSSIPAKPVFVPYAPKHSPFSLLYPKSWQRGTYDVATTFTDRHDDEIAVATTGEHSAPTIASVRANYLLNLRPYLGFKLLGIDTVTRPAGRAVRIRYEEASVPNAAGTRITLDNEQYLFWHRGLLLILTLSTRHGTNNARAWRTITNSLAWTTPTAH